MADSHAPRVQFGPFVCDTSTGELWKGGRPIRLQEQPRQLLLALLGQPGEVVSREQLRRRLWPDNTFVDFDNALNVGIRRIREALGDVAPTARYVETVRGRGYRFIAPVLRARPAAGDRPPAAEPPPGASDSPTRAGHRLHRPIMIALAMAIAAFAFPMLRSAAPDRRVGSIAVLRFHNLLEDDEREYLVDGLSDAIRQRLAARIDVRVLAGGPALEVTTGQSSPSAVARRLGVDALLVGSVSRLGAGAVVNVQLIDGATERLRWAGRFERSLDELSVPDQIVEGVASSIGAVTAHSAPPRVAPEVAPEARDAYLRGRFFWARRGRSNGEMAVRHLSAAITLQPDFAEAWTALAEVYAVTDGGPSPVIVPWPGDTLEAGLRAVQEALRLNPESGEAHAALGKLHVGRRRWSEAERAFAKSIELTPDYSTARQWYGTMLARLRRCDEGLEQVKAGARLDPLSALVNEAVGSVYLVCGEPRRALEVFDSVLVMHPAAPTTRQRRADALSRLGRHEESIVELRQLAAAFPGASMTGSLAVAYARAGRAADAHETLRHVSAFFLRAQAFAALGDPERMWDMLEQSLAKQGGALANLLAAPEFEQYRHDPRFTDFARRAGFPLPIRDARFRAGSPETHPSR